MNVDAFWYFGSSGLSYDVEKISASNVKRTWVNQGLKRDWSDNQEGEGREFLRQATEIKNIWIPFGGVNPRVEYTKGVKFSLNFG